MVTGAALRRGHAALQCSNRRTHLGEVTAHWATAARAATLTAVWSSLVEAGAACDMASNSAVLRASEQLRARSAGCATCDMIPRGVSDHQVAPGAQPGRPTAR
jgi:hypothetical protein